MQEEQSRRKPRTPLSTEELFYFKKLKEFKELERIQSFKKSKLYKIINFANVLLLALISYCLLSILICNYWQQATIARIECKHKAYNRQQKAPEIYSIEIETTNGQVIQISTSDFYNEPQVGHHFYIGKDFIFHKELKVKFNTNERVFWHQYTYPKFILIMFSLGLVFFIYKVNKHLTFNGLIISVVLLTLSCLYFIVV